MRPRRPGAAEAGRPPRRTRERMHTWSILKVGLAAMRYAAKVATCCKCSTMRMPGQPNDAFSLFCLHNASSAKGSHEGNEPCPVDTQSFENVIHRFIDCRG